MNRRFFRSVHSIGHPLPAAGRFVSGRRSNATDSHPLAGSSSIYYHDQPKVCANWLTRFAGVPAVYELAGRSGTGIHVYLRPDFKPEYGLKAGETILERIAREKYGFVVLQVPAEFINGPEGEEHDRSIDVYCEAIRSAGGIPRDLRDGLGA